MIGIPKRCYGVNGEDKASSSAGYNRPGRSITQPNDPGLRRGRLVWGFCFSSGFFCRSVAAVAARWLDRRRLLRSSSAMACSLSAKLGPSRLFGMLSSQARYSSCRLTRAATAVTQPVGRGAMRRTLVGAVRESAGPAWRGTGLGARLVSSGQDQCDVAACRVFLLSIDSHVSRNDPRGRTNAWSIAPTLLFSGV
jgi:hypothetical protein